MLIMDRYFGSVRCGVCDFREGTTLGLDRLGGAFISDFGGCVIPKSTLKVVTSVDVLFEEEKFDFWAMDE